MVPFVRQKLFIYILRASLRSSDDFIYRRATDGKMDEDICLALLSTPLVCICLVSLLHLLLVHVPYLSPDCGSVRCAAGSMPQFVVWSIVLVLGVGSVVACVLNNHCTYISRTMQAKQKHVLRASKATQNHPNTPSRGESRNRLAETRASWHKGLPMASKV